MRIYSDVLDAVREVERDLWEMGIAVQIQTMQDKRIANDPDYLTKELQSYAFQIVPGPTGILKQLTEPEVVNYVLTGKKSAPAHERLVSVLNYIEKEFRDRVGGVALNPGNSWQERKDVWNEFMHEGKFSYTYSERLAPQLKKIITQLQDNPGTRQAILNIHSNIAPLRIPDGNDPPVVHSDDLSNTGGSGRIPCSMYYQIMLRNDAVDFVYTMRSCDYLTHFAVDLILALRMQQYIAEVALAGKYRVGRFTYFTGSLHAYAKDMRARGIF